MRVIAGLLFLTLPAAAVAPAPSVPFALFSQMANHAQYAKGELRLTLGAGTTITRVAGTPDIQWIVRPGISATVKFEYSGAEWKTLRLAFSDWIEAALRNGANAARRQKITAIDFRKNGQPLEYYDDTGNAVAAALSTYPELLAHLKVANGPASLLLGDLFAGLQNSPSGGGQGLMVARVGLDGMPPTTLTIATGTSLPLSPGVAGAEGSWLRVGPPLTVNLNALAYSPVDRGLTMRTGPLATALGGARLASGKTALLAGDGASWKCTAIELSTSDAGRALTVTDGALTGKLVSGSQLEITRNLLGSTMLLPQPSAESRVSGLSLLVRSDGAATLTAGSAAVPLAGQNARVVFDHRNLLDLSLQSGALVLESGWWMESELPRVRGSLASVNATVAGGVLGFDRTRLRLRGGSLVSDGLQLGTQNSNTVTGVVREVNLTLDAHSMLNAGMGSSFELAGGTLTSGALTFDSGFDGPSGEIAIGSATIDWGVLQMGRQALLAITSPAAGFATTRKQPDAAWSLTGDLKVATGVVLVDPLGSFAVESGTISVADLALSDGGVTGGSVPSLDVTVAPQVITYGDKLSVVALGPSRLRLGKAAAVSPNGEMTGLLSLGVPIVSGSIQMGQASTLELNGGSLNFAVDTSPGVAVAMTLDVDVHVKSGILRVLPGSEIVLGEGTVQAKAMAATTENGFVGPLARADLAIVKSSFTLGKGFHITSKAGRFTAGSEAAPLRISKNGVSGRFSLTAALDTMQSATSAGFSVKGGDLDLELEEAENHDLTTQSGSTSFLHGANVHFQTDKGDKVNLKLNMEKISLTAKFGEAPVLVSDLRGTFDEFSLNVVTEGKEGYTDKDGGHHDDARFFPLTLTAALDTTQASLVSADRYTITAGAMPPPLAPTVHLLLRIPPGDGEHPHSSIHEAGNHGGPDRMHNAQEAFTDTYPACRIHIYFLEGTYKVSAALDLSKVWNGGKVSVSSIQLSPPITRNENSTTQGWDRDGCDGPFMKIVAIGFSALIVGAIAGPVGGFFVGALGNALVDFAEDRLDNWIDAQVASRIQSLQFSQ